LPDRDESRVQNVRRHSYAQSISLVRSCRVRGTIFSIAKPLSVADDLRSSSLEVDGAAL